MKSVESGVSSSEFKPYTQNYQHDVYKGRKIRFLLQYIVGKMKMKITYAAAMHILCVVAAYFSVFDEKISYPHTLFVTLIKAVMVINNHH